MTKQSKHETADHWKTSDHSRALCDLMLACLPAESQLKRSISKKTCGVDVLSQKPALYWLYHSKDHVRVYPYGKFILGLTEKIQKLLPTGVLLQTRTSLASDRALLTPCFFVFQTEEQARGMGPLLTFLSDHRFGSLAVEKSAENTYWHPLSESEELLGASAEEGKRVTAVVNKFEGDKKNRECCIHKYKAVCAVCGFDFSVSYGEIGDGYIHVHHLTPLHTFKGKARKVDPIKDMRPVCPNCHEMLHRADPPYEIEKLQEIMAIAKIVANQRSLPG